MCYQLPAPEADHAKYMRYSITFYCSYSHYGALRTTLVNSHRLGLNLEVEVKFTSQHSNLLLRFVSQPMCVALPSSPFSSRSPQTSPQHSTLHPSSSAICLSIHLLPTASPPPATTPPSTSSPPSHSPTPTTPHNPHTRARSPPPAPPPSPPPASYPHYT